MRFNKSLLIAAVAIAVPFVSQADPVNSNTDLSVGSYSFDDFSCSTVKGGASMGTCGSIKVSTISQPLTGLQFQTESTALGYGFDDAVINYHVHSGGQINNIGLDFNGYFLGYAISSVTETVKNDAGSIVGFATVTCGATVGCTQQDDVLLKGSFDDLYVTKDINVTSFAGLAQISYVDQTFNGCPTPEPSSFMLLGSALVGVGGLLRRRSKAAAKA